MKIPRINIGDKATYFYIKRIKKWMFCPVCKDGKMTFNKKKKSWQCEECEYELSENEFTNDYIFWFCDGCDSYLNVQEGFDLNASSWTCCNCGHETPLTFDSITGVCSECGKSLPDPDATLCADCRQKRKEMAIEKLKSLGTIVGIGAIALLAAVSSGDNDNRPYSETKPTYIDDDDIDDEANNGLHCAHCGNSDERFLVDEGDTLYCKKCAKRTLKATGEKDVVECPYCHRMRDRKAYYCWYCNDSTWQPSTKKEFEEIDELLKREGY